MEVMLDYCFTLTPVTSFQESINMQEMVVDSFWPSDEEILDLN